MTRDEYDRRVAGIKARHPPLFAGDHIGHHVAPGWLAIVADLCARIDGALDEAERPCVHFSQIKEKLGGLRTYLNVAPLRVDFLTAEAGAGFSAYASADRTPDLFTRLAPFVEAAEEESYRTCVFCGAPGRLREDRSWLLTLCDRHAACSYAHLELAFEQVTDPKHELQPPSLEQAAAALGAARVSLQDLGARRLGLCPPATPGACCRLVVAPAEGRKAAVYAILRRAGEIVGWPLDEGLDHGAAAAGGPEDGDVIWIF